MSAAKQCGSGEITVKKNNEYRKISSIIQKNLLVVCLASLIVSLVLYFQLQTIYLRMHFYALTDSHVKDVKEEIEDVYVYSLADKTIEFMEYIETYRYSLDNKFLKDIVRLNSKTMSEINIVDKNGIVTYSSVPSHVGFDMHSGKQSSEFLCLLGDEDYYYEQELMPMTQDPSVKITYTATSFSKKDGFAQFGMTEKKYHEFLEQCFADEIRYRHIGLNGYMLVLNKDGKVVGSLRDKYNHQLLTDTSILPEKDGEYTRHETILFGKRSYVVSTMNRNYYIMGVYPLNETTRFHLVEDSLLVLMFILIVGSIYIALSRLLRKNVVIGIEKINSSLSQITQGDLDERVNVWSSLEFKELSEGINETVEWLEEMIDEANRRIDEELEMARIIQSTSLPNVFPPFPKKKEIGLFASMDTAKEVGGDFYDYYMLQGNILAVLIADVSDKGIPAALFMMRAKTVLKGLTVSGLSVDEVVRRANEDLVNDNEADMFVTLWIGFLDLNNGLMHYVHAGHTCPALIRNERASLVKQKRNLIVGTRSGTKYLDQVLQLKPGDILFLYTDGVTEAFNADEEEYGSDRMVAALEKLATEQIGNDDPNACCEAIIRGVRADVASFASGIQQSDDITMLCIKYSEETTPV